MAIETYIISSGDENGNDDELKALEILKNGSSITAKQMAERMNISPRKVSRLKLWH